MIAIICGLPKSASSFAAQVTRAIAEAAGFNQAILRSKVQGFSGGGAFTGFLPYLDRRTLEEILNQVRDEELIVLKTHGSRPKYIESLESQGLIKAIVTFRDPRDAALSVYEAGVRAREKGDTSQAFFNINSIEASIDFIARQWEYTSTWLDDESSIKVEYRDLTRNLRDVSAEIIRFIGVPVDVGSTLDPFFNGSAKPYNYNVGVSGRGIQQFTDKEKAYSMKRLSAAIEFVEKWPSKFGHG